MTKEELQDFLIKNNINQSELAYYLGYSRSLVSHYLAGRREISARFQTVLGFWVENCKLKD